MNRLIDALFSATLLPTLVRLVHALLAPVLRAIALPAAELATVLRMAAAELRGEDPTVTPLGGYTLAETNEVIESLALLLRGVADDFKFAALTNDRIAALLDGVANRVAA